MPYKDIVNNESSEPPLAPVPPGADDAGGVSDAKWFVAIVNPRHEKAIAGKLLQINVNNYVATQREVHVWANGRRKTVDRVVIPSTIFIHCSEARRREIVRLPYIHRFMVNRSADSGRLTRPIAVIPDEQMHKLMFMLGQADTPVDFVPTLFRVNDNVKVLRGPLRGLTGEITENSDGTHVLSVALSMLGGAKVKINPQDVERLP